MSNPAERLKSEQSLFLYSELPQLFPFLVARLKAPVGRKETEEFSGEEDPFEAAYRADVRSVLIPNQHPSSVSRYPQATITGVATDGEGRRVLCVRYGVCWGNDVVPIFLSWDSSPSDGKNLEHAHMLIATGKYAFNPDIIYNQRPPAGISGNNYRYALCAGNVSARRIPQGYLHTVGNRVKNRWQTQVTLPPQLQTFLDRNPLAQSDNNFLFNRAAQLAEGGSWIDRLSAVAQGFRGL